VFPGLSIMAINLFYICRAPQGSPTASMMADTMEEGLLTAVGSELDTGTADAADRYVYCND
jgi:hypothetical protein